MAKIASFLGAIFNTFIQVFLYYINSIDGCLAITVSGVISTLLEVILSLVFV